MLQYIKFIIKFIYEFYYSNDVQSRYWDNGELNFPPSKSQGRTVMTSDFLEPISGFLEYQDVIWAELKVNKDYFGPAFSQVGSIYLNFGLF